MPTEDRWRSSTSASSSLVYLVASLTSSPTRVGMIGPTLATLGAAHQRRPFDEVLLVLPRTFARTGEPYPEPLPLDTAGVTVLRCEHDWGPATKLVPTVRYLATERAAAIAARLGLPPGASPRSALERVHIVVVDDDSLYPPQMARSLASTATPTRSECAGGWNVVARTALEHEGAQRPVLLMPHLAPVHVCEGFSGWRLPLGPLAHDVEGFEARMRALTSDADLRLSDDLVISDQLARAGVRLAHHRTAGFNILLVRQRALGFGADALHRTDTAGSSHSARYARIIRSGRLDALPSPERWATMCAPQPSPPLCAPRLATPAAAADSNSSSSRGACAGAGGAERAAVAVLGAEHTGARTCGALLRANMCAPSVSASAEADKATRRAMRTWQQLDDSARGVDAARASLLLVHRTLRRPVVIAVREPLQWLNALQRAPGACAHAQAARTPKRRASGCSVRQLAAAAAGRTARLRLAREALGLVRAPPVVRESGPRGELPAVRSAASRAGGDAGPVVLVRYEDVVTRPGAVGCMLGHALGLCTLRPLANLAVGATPAREREVFSPERGALDMGVVGLRARLAAVSPHPCTAVGSYSKPALTAVLSALDWELEQLVGYAAAEREYRSACAGRGGNSSLGGMLRHTAHGLLSTAMRIVAR